jgi:hypothetical protein
MRGSNPVRWLAPLALLVTACASSPASGPDAGVDLTAPAQDVGPEGPAADTAPADLPDAGQDAPADLPTAAPDLSDLPPTTLPLSRAALSPVSTGPTNDYESAGFEEADGTVTVVVERFDTDPNHFASSLQVVRGPTFDSLGASEPLDLVAQPFVAGPRSFQLADSSYLYFMGGDYAAGTLRLCRSRHAGGTFETPEPLVLQDGYTGNIAWPTPALRDDGTVALGYDHYQLTVQVAIGDGLNFEPPVQLGSGVQGRVAAYRGTGLAFTYQDGNLPDTCYVRVSADGASWLPAIPLADGPNGHDASPFSRLDGGVDLYYIYPASAVGFALFRRSVTVDGTLGPEQRITQDDAGSFTQPHPLRLGDGRILLTFAAQVMSNVDTDSWLVVIAGDAPP